ncbi:glutamic acid-rich protein [Drosophila albomicans]|uniref:Glutamic acid-rich protein n=1 Tax=Drosophila albomicans TaxID=7291 RepID=A0A6P8XBD8_DROAB|nr:glutamic acid-rich protein [Drosophila albomicans]
MLQLFSVARCFRLPYRVIPHISNANLRLMSDKSKKDGDKKNSKEGKCDKLKDEEVKSAKGKKDETAISGGGKCANKHVETAPKCPPKKCEAEPPDDEHSNCWRKISLFCALPLVAILTLLVFTTRHEEERPEFKFWPHMYKRSKPFFFKGGGNRSMYHNPHWNALPPDGYEDEIDLDADGKPAETDQEREQRLKEFATLNKDWKKHDGKREAERKKAEAAAEKEAKRLQAEADKEEKKQRAEEEKERKRQEAEEKKQKDAEEKELKRLEAEEKKRLQEEAKAQKVDYDFPLDAEPDVPVD